MKSARRAGVTLSQARRIALALPQTTEAPHFTATSFRVGGKIFATAPADESCLHVFVPEEDRERWVALQPKAIEKLFWGARAVGLKVTLRHATPSMIKALLTRAWSSKAPGPSRRSTKRGAQGR